MIPDLWQNFDEHLGIIPESWIFAPAEKMPILGKF